MEEAKRVSRGRAGPRLSEMFLRAAIDSLPFDFFAIGDDGRYVLQNSSCVERWGNTIGRTPADVAPDPETLAIWLDNNERAWSGETVRGEVSFLLQGKRRHFFNILCPVLDGDKTLGIMGVNIDITDRKELEEELLHAQKMEAVGTLAGGIAHDFSNLLQGIGGFAELLLLDLGDNAEHREALSRILDNARKGRDLTRQILTFSRKVPTQKRPIDLNWEIREVQSLLDRTLSGGIEIQLDLTPLPLVVDADPVQVQQVLVNLAVNARDAMPDGGRLTFRTSRVATDRPGGPGGSRTGPSRARLEVEDTGVGMDEGTMARIFDPFFTTKDAGLGTGLGLSVVYGIVESHDGAISCRSRLGNGSVFEVELPLKDGEAQPAHTQDVAGRGGTETILVIDDDEGSRSVFGAILGRFGYRVVAPPSSSAAIEAFRERPEAFDLIVVDLGAASPATRKLIETVRSLRADAKVVTASGHDPVARQLQLVPEADAALEKPFTAHTLLQTLRDVLDAPP